MKLLKMVTGCMWLNTLEDQMKPVASGMKAAMNGVLNQH